MSDILLVVKKQLCNDTLSGSDIIKNFIIRDRFLKHVALLIGGLLFRVLDDYYI